MKKRNTTIAAVLLTVSLTVLFAEIIIPVVFAVDVEYACVCNHFDVRQEDTYYDEYTGTGITAQLSGGYLWTADYIFQRGLGGYYSPAPPLVDQMYIHYEWFENGMGYQDDFTWNSPIPWTYPVDPFGGEYPYYHCQTKDLSDFIYRGEYVGASTDSYFPWPPNPQSYFWYCDGSLAQVFA